jgi:hypothetical protein
MLTVIYTHDFEPIAVIDLPPWALDYVARHGFVRLAVLPPLRPACVQELAPTMSTDHVVDIRAERQRFPNGREHYLLLTRDEEAALLLKAAFLPGQQGALRDMEKAEFARGFMEALHRLG